MKLKTNGLLKLNLILCKVLLSLCIRLVANNLIVFLIGEIKQFFSNCVKLVTILGYIEFKRNLMRH